MKKRKGGAHLQGKIAKVPSDRPDMENSAPQKKKHKVLIIVLSVVLAVILIAGVAIYAIFNKLYSRMNYDTGLSEEELNERIENYNPDDYRDEADGDPDESGQDLTDEELSAMQQEIQQEIGSGGSTLISEPQVKNILLLGSDARTKGSYSRTDAMILLSINEKTKQITLTSFMRDIYTYIPGAGYYNRLNVPNAIGGPTFQMETMESVFGIDIDNYVEVNFFSFINVVDQLGGVDIEVTAGEISEINRNLKEQNKLQGYSTSHDNLSTRDAGEIHLNGNQALAYARIRHIGGDQGRTERQRTVLITLMEKVKTMSLTELYALVDVILPEVTTDLTQTDCLSLALSAMNYFDYDIQSLRIPDDGNYTPTMINGMSVLRINFDYAKRYLQEHIYGITE